VRGCRPRAAGLSWLAAGVGGVVASFRASRADSCRAVSRREVERAEVTAKTPGESLPRTARLRSGGDFRSVMTTGRRGVSQYVVAFHRGGPAGSRESRLGVVASRKVGKAHRRNRSRRRLREIWRRSGERPVGDLVLLARAGIADAPWASLRRAYHVAVRRALGRGRRPK